MVLTNCTNTHSLPSYRWFLGNKPRRNPEKVNSLVYKDYTLVELEDGTKSYVSPEDKARLLLNGKHTPPSVPQGKENPGQTPRDPSDSESEYEIPVVREKPSPLEAPRLELKRTSSYPFPDEEMSPGDNGRINLPPYIVPLETSLTLPMTKQKKALKKKKSKGGEGNDAFWVRTVKESSAEESPEDAEVREITEGRGRGRGVSMPESSLADDSEEKSDAEKLEEPREVFPRKDEGTSRPFRPFSLPQLPREPRRVRERNKRVDMNPLKKMFGIRGVRREEGGEEVPFRSEEEEDFGRMRERYSDAALSELQSDTESADHGSADKSSVTKLTNEKRPKKLMSGLLGSFRKGKTKGKVPDEDAAKNPSSFEITLKEQPEEMDQTESVKAEGIVYAELDMARSPGSVMRREDEKTEYAEIIYPGTKLTAERAVEELRKSRENLASSRENLTEVDEAYSTTPDGKKEAAV